MRLISPSKVANSNVKKEKVFGVSVSVFHSPYTCFFIGFRERESKKNLDPNLDSLKGYSFFGRRAFS